jgi:hypothetical protein
MSTEADRALVVGTATASAKVAAALDFVLDETTTSTNAEAMRAVVT